MALIEIDDFPTKTSIYNGFPIVMLVYQRVLIVVSPIKLIAKTPSMDGE